MADRIPQFHPILHAARLIMEKLREDLADFGGTSTQGRVLDVIDRLEEPIPARVGEALGMTASAMSQMVQRLRKAELIEASQRTKGRPYSEHLVLTESGEDLLRQTRRVWADTERALVGLIGEEALNRMFHTSYDIVEGLGAHPPFARHLHLERNGDGPAEHDQLETTEQGQ